MSSASSSGPADPVVRTTVDGAVGTVVLDRPQALNAVTVALGRQLEAALRDLATRVRVVVVRGAGGNFCVGGDFHELQRLLGEGPAATAELFDAFGRACAAVGEVDVPVVCAVQGYAMAGGFELLQASDIVLVSADATIADNHLNFAQVPGGGGSQRLPRLVGRQRALAHILTGDRLSGTDAVAWGLAHAAYPPAEFEASVAAFAQRLATKDPRALATAKRLVRDGAELPLAQGLAAERQAVLAHLAGSAAAAGITSFTKG